MYSISQFARKAGISGGTLRRWESLGKLVPIRLESGHRRYTDEHLFELKGLKKNKRKNVIYARESTKQQENSLKNQVSALKQFCLTKGIEVDLTITDFGSGLNYKRKGLSELIGLVCTDQVDQLVVYYPDRLMRFGLELFYQLCAIHNVTVIFVDRSETEKSQQEEFADDLISIIHYFSMRMYGSRSYKKSREKEVSDELA